MLLKLGIFQTRVLIKKKVPTKKECRQRCEYQELFELTMSSNPLVASSSTWTLDASSGSSSLSAAAFEETRRFFFPLPPRLFRLFALLLGLQLSVGVSGWSFSLWILDELMFCKK